MNRTGLTLTIDEQHRKIVQACKHLEEALTNNAPRCLLAERFNDLIEYAGEHFRDEELLLEKNYSYNLNAHREEHEEYITALLEAVAPLKGESGYRYHNIHRELLTPWWMAHIEREDSELPGLANSAVNRP